MKKFNLKEHIAKNKATFYSSLQENESTKNMKESKLRSKIKEMILAELAESNIDINDTTDEYDFLAEEDYDRDRDAKAMGYRNAEEADEDNWGLPKETEEDPKASLNEEEDEEVEVEDTEETEDVEVNTDEVDPTVKAVQDALAQAQAAAQKLGDEKLTDQIGNTITFFTRAHVSKPSQNNLMENNQTLFPMLKKILK
jgi:hypothetical protein